MVADVATRRARRMPARRAAAMYRHCGWADFVQVQARRVTCPLWEIDGVVPRSGHILEVGCGRGLVSALLAASSAERHVVGIDVDARKIAVADRMVTGAADARSNVPTFATMPSGEHPEGTFDAVLFAEVLYLLPKDERRRLILDAVGWLAPGGVLVVKEVDRAPRWKHTVNVAHNWVLMRLLDNLVGTTMDNVGPVFYEKILADAGLSTVSRRLDRGFPYAHFIVVANEMSATDG